MIRILPIFLLGGSILFLCGVSFTGVVLILILVVLGVIFEDMAMGGNLTSNLIKEIKNKPTVIHDVVIERDEEDTKWMNKFKEESESSKVYSTEIIRHTGRGNRR